jgi:long-chain acyl-CoA synthetase
MSRSVSASALVSTPQQSELLAQSADYSKIQSIAQIWGIAAQRFGSVTALLDLHGKSQLKLTYAQLDEQICQFAAGLEVVGIEAGQHVALFSDNGPRWLIADQGIMTLGAVDVVRGSQAEREELLYILSHSDSVALIVEDLATLKKLTPQLDSLPVPLVITLSDEASPAELRVLNFAQIMDAGKARSPAPVHYDRNALATLMYTSGTSGMPKGVMLSHSNLISQILAAATVVQPDPGERVLSILPIWHCYERTFEYFIFSRGCTQIYTNIRSVKKDLKEFQPQYMVAVPRLWESIYEGVQKQLREQTPKQQRLVNFFLKLSQQYIVARRTVQSLTLDNLNPSGLEKVAASLRMIVLWGLHQLGDKLVYRKIREATGGNIKYVVSGGGSIAEHLEDFYELIGIEILGGYGLTETSPITHVRRPLRNLRGADGQPLPNTETQIVDPETRKPLPVGQQGLVLIRGPQVMQGYYKNPEATAKAIDTEGWFDTGDLGLVTAWDDLVITGRAKDTIVLTNGENIEPQPIEDACLRSPYVDQIMLVGQDQKSLGALIVPNFETLQQWAATQNLSLRLPNDPPAHSARADITLDSKAIQDLFRKELNREVQNRPGYRPDDRIGPIQLIQEPFSIENGMLTQTLKIRRAVVMERYQGMIDKIFND